MAGPELQAFRKLDRLGLILEGEFYSPSKADQSHYTELLKAAEGITRRPVRKPRRLVSRPSRPSPKPPASAAADSGNSA